MRFDIHQNVIARVQCWDHALPFNDKAFFSSHRPKEEIPPAWTVHWNDLAGGVIGDVSIFDTPENTMNLFDKAHEFFCVLKA